MKSVPHKVATRAIILINGKVLLGKRSAGHGAGKYALVGGKPEKDEPFEETIVREVKEEIGVLFKDAKFWKKELDKNSIPGELWDVYYFVGEAEGELKLEPGEISDTILVGKEDLPTVDMAFDHRKILEEFFTSRI